MIAPVFAPASETYMEFPERKKSVGSSEESLIASESFPPLAEKMDAPVFTETAFLVVYVMRSIVILSSC